MVNEDALIELEEAILSEVRAKAQDDFYTFVMLMAPYEIPEGFVDGEHVRILCKALQDLEAKDGGRLMISLPPRSMKSTLTSILFPAWCFGRHPSWQMMSLSHSNELAKDFGRRIRNLVSTVDFQKIFPGTSVSPDTRAAHKWGTTKKGVYNSAGVETGLAGKGANLGIVDDPLSEQTAMTKQGREFVKNLWGPGFRSRLQPNGKIVIVMTRWHEDDLIGWLLSLEKMGGVDRWTVINTPAIIDEDTEKERSYWPEYWSLKALKDKRDDPSLETSSWNALYQGNPTPSKGVLMLRDNFQRWPTEKKLPACQEIILSCDTAFTDKTANDPSALQVWGIFSAPFVDSRGKEHLLPNAILLANRVDYWQYPALLEQVRELIKAYNPDRLVIENKASGIILIQDMQSSGIPISPFTPGKGQDKTSRVQAILRFLNSGRIWVPETRWGDKFIDECTAFPKGKHDDQVDAFTMGVIFLRDAAALYTADSLRAQDEIDDTPKKARKTYWTRLTRPAA